MKNRILILLIVLMVFNVSCSSIIAKSIEYPEESAFNNLTSLQSMNFDDQRKEYNRLNKEWRQILSEQVNEAVCCGIDDLETVKRIVLAKTEYKESEVREAYLSYQFIMFSQLNTIAIQLAQNYMVQDNTSKSEFENQMEEATKAQWEKLVESHDKKFSERRDQIIGTYFNEAMSSVN